MSEIPFFPRKVGSPDLARISEGGNQLRLHAFAYVHVPPGLKDLCQSCPSEERNTRGTSWLDDHLSAACRGVQAPYQGVSFIFRNLKGTSTTIFDPQDAQLISVDLRDMVPRALGWTSPIPGSSLKGLGFGLLNSGSANRDVLGSYG
jgi:hypothetical protein